MNQYYYLIPTYNTNTYLNGTRFDRMLELYCEELYLLEKEKEELSFRAFEYLDEYNNIRKRIAGIHKWIGFPEYIVCVEENGVFRELVTNGVVVTRNIAEFERYEFDFDIVCEYINDTNYCDKFNVYYSQFLTHNSNNLIRRFRTQKKME